MRLIQLTPGTGNFYCGSCLRDNALVTALRELGHDAHLMPMYLPHLVDEESASTGEPLLFGGINVYLQQKSGLFRRTPGWLDKLLDSPSLLRRAAGQSSMTSARDLGEITLSMLEGEHGRQAKEVRKLIAWVAARDRPPHVISLSNILLAGLAPSLRRELGIPVVCTMQGEDGFLDALPEPYREQCWKKLRELAGSIAGFVAVSRYYKDEMVRRLNLAPETVRVVHNGISLDGYRAASHPPNPPVIGFLARMCQAKGLDTLVEAFIELKARGQAGDARLRIAGAKTPADENFVKGLQQRLREKGLEAQFLPNLSRGEKQEFLRGLTVLSVPARGESFGLYVLEALASGVPVVQPREGGFPELIEATGGGLLYDDGANGLAAALEKMLMDQEVARQLGQRGREAVVSLFTREKMAANFAEVCQEVLT